MTADAGAGMHMMAAMSDPRAKKDVVRVGRHALGLDIYRFSYRAPFDKLYGPGRRVGFMADEVAAKYPDAVAEGPGGYLMVDYGRLLQ